MRVQISLGWLIENSGEYFFESEDFEVALLAWQVLNVLVLCEEMLSSFYFNMKDK